MIEGSLIFFNGLCKNGNPNENAGFGRQLPAWKNFKAESIAAWYGTSGWVPETDSAWDACRTFTDP